MLKVSAPGKLIVAGEYAVLEGGPAIVMAINRRARLSLEPNRRDRWSLRAPEIDVPRAAFRVSQRQIEWDADPTKSLSIVDSVLRMLAERHIISSTTPAANIEVRTDALWEPGTRTKLGLGSSAVVSAGLTRLLMDYVGNHNYAWSTFDAGLFHLLEQTHTIGQGKRGSGVDIGATLCGGVVRFSNHAGDVRADPITWPRGLYWKPIWTGRPASTAERLNVLGRYRQDNPAAFTEQMTSLCHYAQDTATAFGNADVPRILECLAKYRDRVAKFGRQTGVDIASEVHQKLIGLGQEQGVVYKPSGAGGGDLGIAFSDNADALEAFNAVARANFFPLDLKIDPDGVRLDRDDGLE